MGLRIDLVHQSFRSIGVHGNGLIPSPPRFVIASVSTPHSVVAIALLI